MSAHSEMVEVAAQAIYDCTFYEGRGTKPPWKMGGNSTNQQLARRYALAAILAMRGEVEKVFEPYLSPEYSVPQCVTSRQISKYMHVLFSPAITEHEER